MSSDLPSSTRPDPEVGLSTPENDPSDARAGLYDAETDPEDGRSAAEDVASEEGLPEAPREAASEEGSPDVPYEAEAAASEEEPPGASYGAEAAASEEGSPDVPYEAGAAASEAGSSEAPYGADALASEEESPDVPFEASEADAAASEADSSEEGSHEPEARPSAADPYEAPYEAESLASEDDASERPYEADAASYDSEASEAPYETDDDAYDDEGDAELLDVDLPQRRRRPLSGEEAAAALFHAKAILQAAAEAGLPEPDDTAEAEPSEPAPDVEADYLRSRLRALSDAAAVVEADAALFDTEADPEAALFGAEAEPEAETLLYEAESALFRAEVALADDEAELVDAAWDARTRAVCTYSGFAVGAALLDVHGQRFTGANVENASYNLGLCAERVALYHALTHGAGRFVAVAIVTEAPTPTSPCGACRQVLWEFAPHAEILLVTRSGHQRLTMRDLLPHAFDPDTLRAAGAATEDPAR
jgi:cytidine deaminase